MSLKESEEKLNDYLLNGLQAEIHWAEEARSVAIMIGRHSERANQTRFGGLFGRLQEVFSERETLAVAKMFDRPSRNHPVRSIGATLGVIEENIDYWALRERSVLEKFLFDSGQGELSDLSHRELSVAIAAYFRSTLPSIDKKENCELSASLDRVFQSRDKVHAHNEAIAPSSRTLPSWKDTELLLKYGKSFVETIAHGFLGVAAIITEPHRTSRLLEQLIAAANLTSDDFKKDERNVWMIQRLRKELLLENHKP